MSISSDCYVLLGRGLCDGSISRPDVSFQCVCVCVFVCVMSKHQSWGSLAPSRAVAPYTNWNRDLPTSGSRYQWCWQVLSPTYFPVYFVWRWEYFVWYWSCYIYIYIYIYIILLFLRLWL
jgi:hypothetical protein